MKVGYIAPASILAVNGGLRTQALQTIFHVQKEGIKTVKLTPWDDLDSAKVDLVHIFGASVENSGIIEQLASQKIPMVISPVFYANRSAEFINRTIRFEKLFSHFGQGIRSDFTIKARLCDLADHILPNTLAEAHLIEKGFTIASDKITVVPNGVETRFTQAEPELFINETGVSDFILFAGQASAPRKNVLSLLKIAHKLDHPLVIIGSFGDDSYGNACKKLAQNLDHVTVLNPLEHDSEMLSSAYAASKVFILPSQFETPGIAAMEAALTGSNIVITERGGTQDYFESFADYVDPDSLDSILQGIQKALGKEKQKDLKEHIINHFGWDKVAKKTIDVYKKVIS